MKRTTVKLPDELDARLRREAARQGVTVSQLTREAIAAHLGAARCASSARPARGTAAAPTSRSGSTSSSGFTASGEQLIVDTGALFALVDQADHYHRRALALLRGFPGELIVPALVIAETAFLVGERMGPWVEATLLADIADSDVTVDQVPLGECIGELVARHADLPLEPSTPPWWRRPSGSGSLRSPRPTGGTSPSSARPTRRPSSCSRSSSERGPAARRPGHRRHA